MSDNKKRMFQVLDEMNIHDTEHGTRFINLCPSLIRMNQNKNGVEVTMGVPFGGVDPITYDQSKQRIVLLIIDGEEYDKRIGK